MTKIIILRLASIQYGGDSIGDELRIEVEILGNFVGFNKKIQRTNSFQLDKEIGQFISDQNFLDVTVVTRIIERDIIFNDFGSASPKIKIDLSQSSPQRKSYQIKVQESRGVTSRSAAQFDLVLEANVAPAPRYVHEENDGWLIIRLEENKKVVAIPAYLKVQMYRIESEREYFLILEGPLRGKKASVKRGAEGLSHLVIVNPHSNTVRASYSVSKKTLSINGRKYLTKDYPSSRWSQGTYDIEIPDAPHKGGLHYPDAKHATTWFRVGHSGDRYIHAGRNSLGCITLIEHARWEEVYALLIKARKGDSVSVGTLQIIE